MTIEAYIANSTKHCLGKWVSFPCPPLLLDDVLDQINAMSGYDYVVLKTMCEIKGLSSCVSKNTSLGELNEAAFLLTLLSSCKHQEVSAFINEKKPDMSRLLIFIQSQLI